MCNTNNNRIEVQDVDQTLALEHFVEALSDPSNNLTYTPLTGERKQSVQDAECLFSLNMVSHEEYQYEENFIGVICDLL